MSATGNSVGGTPIRNRRRVRGRVNADVLGVRWLVEMTDQGVTARLPRRPKRQRIEVGFEALVSGAGIRRTIDGVEYRMLFGNRGLELVRISDKSVSVMPYSALVDLCHGQMPLFPGGAT